jgi:hypothetical protein
LHSVSLRPTDEVGEDGWQFFLIGRDLDMSKVAQSKELIFEIIASVIPTEIAFNKLVWASEFRCVCPVYTSRNAFIINFFQSQYPHGEQV